MSIKNFSWAWKAWQTHSHYYVENAPAADGVDSILCDARAVPSPQPWCAVTRLACAPATTRHRCLLAFYYFWAFCGGMSRQNDGYSFQAAVEPFYTVLLQYLAVECVIVLVVLNDVGVERSFFFWLTLFSSGIEPASP